MSGCSATRCARFTNGGTSSRCCWLTLMSARVLTPAEIEHAFDLNDQLKHVDDVFERVFQEVAV